MKKRTKARKLPGQPSPPIPSTWLMRESDAAKILSVPRSRLKYWRLQGGGPRWVQLGASIRYRMADLDAFIEANVRTDGVLHTKDLMSNQTKGEQQ